ncbi:MAG: molybdopterin-synthase adenylyltransferase MoeB [Bacteroidota bacterium]
MDKNALSHEELARYSRHLIIPEFNIEGQRRLKQSRVLVVGAGGLGSPLLQYLAAAGVGKIGIIDPDVVDESNLQRQVLYGQSSVGLPKVEEARTRIEDINPYIEVETYQDILTSDNALQIIDEYDIVADGTDNFPTRYLVNDACVLLGKVNVYASIFQFEGQVSVFNYLDKEGNRGPNYRDLFPTPPPPGMVPSCAEGGVLGVLPGIIGSMQALEVIKLASGVGKPLSGRMLLFDALSFTTRILKLSRNPENPLNGEEPTQTGLIDYEQFCGVPVMGDAPIDASGITEITVQEFEELKKSGKDFQLIDVREVHEYEIVNLGGELIPKGEIPKHLDRIARNKAVIVHCKGGARSAKVVKMLESKYGFTQICNLKGGLLAYIEEIDSSLPKY